MTPNEYQKLSTRTMNPNLNLQESLDNMAYGIVGEVGEVIDLLKKSKFQGHELNKDKLQEEIGDVMFYIANLCTLNNISLEVVLENNVDKLKKRYPGGFKVSDSVNREEK